MAATLYKKGDYRPFLYHTKDYGKSWELIVDGIKADHFTRVIRADNDQKGLLFAGTETGLYVSSNDGKSWKPFKPICPLFQLLTWPLRMMNC